MNDNGDQTTTQEDDPATIMLVEPDILARMALAEYLRECGYKVLEGVTAADVFSVLHAGLKIDVVLAEVSLPGDVDGFHLAQQVRDQFPETDVLLTSSPAKAADKAGDLCEDGPLDKPYHPQEVLRRIHILRERRRTAQKP